MLGASALAAAALLTSGCAVFSPVQTDEDYLAGDGTQIDVPGLSLRNLVVVSQEDGGPGVLVGQAVNTGDSAVQVTFGVAGAPAGDSATVPPRSTGPISPEPDSVVIASVPGAPGGMVDVIVTTREAGENIVAVPVLPPTGTYEGLLP